jgi:hypothetical protein
MRAEKLDFGGKTFIFAAGVKISVVNDENPQLH